VFIYVNQSNQNYLPYSANVACMEWFQIEGLRLHQKFRTKKSFLCYSKNRCAVEVISLEETYTVSNVVCAINCHVDMPHLIFLIEHQL
jgi:hypothetical protein